MGTLVYRYGLLPPHENARMVYDQMRAAHNYRNELVFIERQRRHAHRRLITEHGDVASMEAALRAADEACAAAARACAAARSEMRTRKAPEALVRSLEAAKAARKQLMKDLAAAKKAAREVLGPQVDLLNERAADLRRGARAMTTAFWGTYLQIESADDQARKAPLYEYGEPNDPRFVRWCGEGFVGVQIQGGIGLDALESDRRLQIALAPLGKGADPTSRRSAMRRNAILSMRIGTVPGGRDPIWARWRMRLHRPLPADAVIKWARVQLRRIGPREEWSVCFTIETNGTRRPVPDQGVVAVDLGWRLVPGDGLRTGAWVASDKQGGFIRVPESVPSGVENSDSLASIRDRTFNEIRQKLATWIGDNASIMPAWFAEATKSLPMWRSSERVVGLVRRWRHQRFVGDEQIYSTCEAWRYNDHHLWAWQESQRTNSLRHRKDTYRVIASQLARQYKTLLLEDKLDLRTWARKEAADGEDHLRRQRAFAAPSELRLALINAFGGPKGGRVVMINQVNTTRECHSCGSIEKWDQAAEIRHTCGSCGTVYDQDVNAAKVMLKRFGERTEKSDASSTTERGGRWAKAKAKKREKATGAITS
jgi:transposase